MSDCYVCDMIFTTDAELSKHHMESHGLDDGYEAPKPARPVGAQVISPNGQEYFNPAVISSNATAILPQVPLPKAALGASELARPVGVPVISKAKMPQEYLSHSV